MENVSDNSLYTREKIRALNLSLSSPKEEARKEELENFRIDSAIKSLEILKTENVGIIADTGTGKTVISFIVILVHKSENKNNRTLFLVPRRSLARQHEKLFHKVEKEGVTQTAVFIGGVKKRRWHDKEKSIIFATPQMFMNDFYRGIADIEYFDEIVIDEFHHSQGNYSYVKIAELAKQYNKKIIGLTASPGDKEEKIEKLKKSSNISKLIRAEVKRPKKLQDVVFAETDETLLLIEQYFFKLFSAVEKRLEQNGIFLTKKREDLGQYSLSGELSILAKNIQYQLLKETELKDIEKTIEKMPKFEEKKWKALMWNVVYRKLKHAYAVCISESYFTFLSYVAKMKVDNTKASQKILASSVFQKIICLAETYKNEHPKILALIENARHLYRLKMRAIIFVGEKVTGEHIKEIMNKKVPISEVAFGGQKNMKKQLEAIEKLKNKELMFLISTSAIEEGLNVPEVDTVVHYSMPMMGISRIQRNGRTARVQTGNIVFIELNHPIDKSLFWITFRAEKNMNEILKKMNMTDSQKEIISESEITPDGKLVLKENFSAIENIYNLEPNKVKILSHTKLLNKKRKRKRCLETLDMFQEKKTLQVIQMNEETKNFPIETKTNCLQQLEKPKEILIKDKKKKQSIFSIICSFFKKIFKFQFFVN